MNRAGATLKNGFKNVSHVIFDMDGLILDTETLYTISTQNVVDEYGKIYTADIKRQLMGLTGTEVSKLIVELLDLPITPEEYREKALAAQSLVMSTAKLMPDTEKIYKNAITKIAKNYGCVYTDEIAKKVLGTPQPELCKIAVKEMKLPLTPEKFNVIFEQQSNVDLPNCSFIPGIEKFVKHLHKHKVPIAVATSSSKGSYDIKTQNHKPFFALFSHTVTGESDPEVKRGKPSPDIFLICAKRFADSPKPSDCLVLEDAPNGVTAAISAGMQCIMVPDPKVISLDFQKEATLVLKSIEELKPEVFGLPPY